MAASKRDDLAKRFADRLQQAPPRGTFTSAAEQRPPSRRGRSDNTSPRQPGHLRRGAAGGRLRGHLVPAALHADARRSKLVQQSRRRTRVTWDDVATEGLELLLAQRDALGRRLGEVRRIADEATSGPRLVQATIPLELDQALGELRLELVDELGHEVRYEQLWATALLLWLRAHR
jgi:hypothetical protein